jgi:hypothetical protein
MENTNYYYIQPSTTVASIGLIIIIIVLFLVIIFKLLFISINWESEKCKNSNFFIAPLLGQNGEATFNKCTSDAMKTALNDTGTEYYNKINKLQNNVTQISTASTTNSGTGTGTSTSTEFSANYNNLLSTVNSIQSSLSKILGSVVLSSYLNKGVLQSTNSLQNGELTNLINQYNTIGENITNQQQARSIISNM